MAGFVFLGLLYCSFIAILVGWVTYMAKYRPDEYERLKEADRAMKQRALETAKTSIGPALLKAALKFLK